MRYLGGILLVLLVVFIWVFSSALIQRIYGGGYNAPFALTYFNTSLFTVYMLRTCTRRRRQSTTRDALLHVDTSIDNVIEQRIVEDGEDNEVDNDDQLAPSDDVQLPPMTQREVILFALQFAPLWFIANVSFNVSLHMTSLASNTIISSTSGFFTLVVGVLFGINSFTLPKLAGVIVLIGGVTLISLEDEEHTEDDKASLLGDAICLLSALFYGVYTNVLKLRLVDESRVSMFDFFGYVGAWNLVLLLPLFPILHYAGLERFSWPSWRTLGWLALNGFVGTVLSDLLWLYSVLLASPLVASLGVSLTIPLAMLVQWVTTHAAYPALYLVGSALVLGGFILTTLAEQPLWWSRVRQCCARRFNASYAR